MSYAPKSDYIAARLMKASVEVIEEFNGGVEDYRLGVPYDHLYGGKHDVKAIGYAWAAFDDLRKECAEAKRLLAGMVGLVDLICNRADMAALEAITNNHRYLDARAFLSK